MASIFRYFAAAMIALGALAAGCGEKDEPAVGSGGIAGLELPTCGVLEYGGVGAPQAQIVSDLPLQGDSAERSRQQVEAIRLVLEQRDWHAGSVAVGFQSCDDSVPQTGLWDARTCRSNAEAYAAEDTVLGVIGTYNSGCAAEEIPILGAAPVAMISPGNTAVCLTERSPICESGQPDSLYPSGTRNYARVVPNDAFQGAALAEFARQERVRRPYVLYADDDPTSTGQAVNFQSAAEDLGMKLAGYETWDPKAHGYAPLFEKVKRSGADAVVLAGLTEQHGAQLIRDKVAVLGSNSKLPLIAFDGFAQQSTIDASGRASRGMYASVPGRVPGALASDGAELVEQLAAQLNGKPVEQFAPYAAEAAAVMLDAIAQAGTDRAAIVDAVLAGGGGGIVGEYSFEASGDPDTGPVTVLRADSSFEPYREITPEPELVLAARG